jgi:type II restriction enzyme
MYCLACDSDRLQAARQGTPVIDFTCPDCQRRYQVKAKKSRFGGVVANSAYNRKMEAIKAGRTPDYLFLQYSRDSMRVVNLFAVPGHFITESVVGRRKPLPPSARRAGWIGSTILLRGLPAEARIQIVLDGHIAPMEVVRHNWQLFSFMRGQLPESRGWLSDVLSCVHRMEKKTFTLADIYQFEQELAGLHPRNKNVRPKIRQQLQVLRDEGIVVFEGGGVYSFPGEEARDSRVT